MAWFRMTPSIFLICLFACLCQRSCVAEGSEVLSTHAVVLGNFTLPNIEITKKAGVLQSVEHYCNVHKLDVGVRVHLAHRLQYELNGEKNRPLETKLAFAAKLYTSNDYEVAIEMYTELLASLSIVHKAVSPLILRDTLLGLGDSYLKKGQLQLAKKMYDKALIIHPTSPDALDRIGKYLFMGNNVDDCIIYLSKALAIVPDDHLTVLKLARVYTFGKGDNKQALALLSKVLEVSPKIVVLACALAQFRDLSANETKSLTPLLYSERFIRGDVQHETFYQDVERFKSDKSLAPLISFASLLGDRLGETRRVVELLKGCLRPATPEKADKAVDTAENGTKYTPSEMHLFVSYKSPETSADSTSEMSIVAHLNSKAVRTVYIVAQAGDFEQLKSQIVEAYGQKLAAKLELFSLSRNPTYSDIFAFANNKLEPGSIIVIASKGVQFDQSLEKLIQHPFPKQSAFALLPYESDRLGIPHMQFAGGEFAALVLETPVTVRVDRYVGSYGSANFVTHRLQRNGIKVSSPSIGIRAVRLESERLKVPPDAMFDTVYEDGFSRVTDRFMNENDL